VFNRLKFKALVHYICYRCFNVDPSSLGSVKLNKILWLSDFMAYRDLQEPITGARYVRRPLGPVPHQILPVLNDLEAEGALTVSETKFHGKPKKTYSVHKPASDDMFTPEEKAIVDRMIDFVCDWHTAASISEFSHDHIWKAAKEGEEIPYMTVFAKPGTITQEDRDWARFQLETDF